MQKLLTLLASNIPAEMASSAVRLCRINCAFDFAARYEKIATSADSICYSYSEVLFESSPKNSWVPWVRPFSPWITAEVPAFLKGFCESLVSILETSGLFRVSCVPEGFPWFFGFAI